MNYRTRNRNASFVENIADETGTFNGVSSHEKVILFNNKCKLIDIATCYINEQLEHHSTSGFTFHLDGHLSSIQWKYFLLAGRSVVSWDLDWNQFEEFDCTSITNRRRLSSVEFLFFNCENSMFSSKIRY